MRNYTTAIDSYRLTPPSGWYIVLRHFGVVFASSGQIGTGRNNMAGYQTQQAGDATEFSTTPEEVPRPWVMVAIPGALLVLIAFASGFLYGLIACAFIYGAMYLLMNSKQATLYRTPAR